MFTEQKWPMARVGTSWPSVSCDCSKLSQLLHDHVFTKPGVRRDALGQEPDHTTLVVLFPYKKKLVINTCSPTISSRPILHQNVKGHGHRLNILCTEKSFSAVPKLLCTENI